MRELFKPSEKGKRDPVSNTQQNGRITNPPRFAQMGGFRSARRGMEKNQMGIKKPGDTV